MTNTERNPEGIQHQKDITTVNNTLREQQSRLVDPKKTRSTVDRWENEDFIAAAGRLAEDAKKWQSVKEVLRLIVPELANTEFSDSSVDNQLTVLYEVLETDQPEMNHRTS